MKNVIPHGKNERRLLNDSPLVSGVRQLPVQRDQVTDVLVEGVLLPSLVHEFLDVTRHVRGQHDGLTHLPVQGSVPQVFPWRRQHSPLPSLRSDPRTTLRLGVRVRLGLCGRVRHPRQGLRHPQDPPTHSTRALALEVVVVGVLVAGGPLFREQEEGDGQPGGSQQEDDLEQ